MTSRLYVQATLPSAEQVLLAKAALLTGEPALQAWEDWWERSPRLQDARWVAGLICRALPEGSYAPFRNELQALAAAEAVRVSALDAALDGVLGILAERGIPAMLLKGAALRRSVYDCPSLRPSVDNDVLVPTKSAFLALRALQAAGATAQWLPSTPMDLRWRHAASLQSAAGNALDLHWHVLVTSCGDRDDDGWWTHARVLDGTPGPVRVLDPTDQLLHVVVHGLRWCEGALPRWVVDAVVLLRRCGTEVDWDRLVERAVRHEVVPPLRLGLSYLREMFAADVPEAVIARLARARTRRLQEWAFRAHVTAPPLRSLRERIAVHADVYRRRRQARAIRPGVRGLASVIAHNWGCTRLSELPAGAARRVMTALRPTALAWGRSQGVRDVLAGRSVPRVPGQEVQRVAEQRP